MVKNSLALIVRVVRAHQVYQGKAEQLKRAPIDLDLIPLKKAIMLVSLKAQVIKIQALETQIPTHHADLDAGSNE